MISRNALLARGRDAVNTVSSCEACDVRRSGPRLYICSYHEGWLDGIEHAEKNGSSAHEAP